MRKLCFFLIGLILLIFVSNLSAQVCQMRVELVQPNGGDVIRAGQPFRIDVYFQNSDDNLTGFYFFPEFYSPGSSIIDVRHMPAEWGEVYFENISTDPDFNTIWPVGLWIEAEGWDEALPEEFHYGGLSLIGTSSFAEKRLFSFSFRIDDPGTFCMQEADLGYTWDDYWPLYTFDPICWEVVEATVCGDADNNDAVNLLDILYIIFCMYTPIGAENLDCDLEVWDFNQDGTTSILDIVYLINYIYNNGPEPLCSSN